MRNQAPDNDHVACRDVLPGVPQHLMQSKKGNLPHVANKAFPGLKFIPMSQNNLKIAMGSYQAPVSLRQPLSWADGPLGCLYDYMAHINTITYYFLSTFGIFRTGQTYRNHGANLPKYLTS